ncbi:MAG: sulfotransferase [Rhodospirillales bacterium]
MDLEVTLPPTAQTISPIMITAPTSHGGTALLQRAICKSENAICYGDNLFEQILSIVDWSTSLIEQHRPRQALEEEALANALTRSPLKWMPDLAPEFRQHMSSIFSVIYNIPHLAEQFALEQDRAVWAMIRQEIPAPLMNDLLSMFPNGKAIIVHRNPFDTIADLLQDRPDSDVSSLCELWNMGMDGYLRFSDARALKLRYEDSTDDPAGFAEKVAEFTGIRGFPTSGIDAGNEAENEATHTLNDVRIGEIRTACADMLTVYYPELA